MYKIIKHLKFSATLSTINLNHRKAEGTTEGKEGWEKEPPLPQFVGEGENESRPIYKTRAGESGLLPQSQREIFRFGGPLQKERSRLTMLVSKVRHVRFCFCEPGWSPFFFFFFSGLGTMEVWGGVGTRC